MRRRVSRGLGWFVFVGVFDGFRAGEERGREGGATKTRDASRPSGEDRKRSLAFDSLARWCVVGRRNPRGARREPGSGVPRRGMGRGRTWAEAMASTGARVRRGGARRRWRPRPRGPASRGSRRPDRAPQIQTEGRHLRGYPRGRPRRNARPRTTRGSRRTRTRRVVERVERGILRARREPWRARLGVWFHSIPAPALKMAQRANVKRREPGSLLRV